MNEQLFSGLTTGAQIGGNILSTWMANRANRQLAQYSYEQQRQMIQEQNEYNSPINQMARYREAGLNPNLLFGQISEGNQGEIAKYNPPHIEPVPVGNVPAMIGQAIQAAMQAELTKADLDIRHQQFENLKEQQFMIRAQRHAQDIDNMYESYVTGFDPGLVSQAGDMDKVANSLRVHQQNASLRSTEALAAQRNASKALIQVQTEVQKLSRREKQYFLDNIQPVMQDIMVKRVKGLEVSNELLELQRKFFTADKIAGYSNQLVNAIVKFINPLSSLGGSGGAGQPNIGPYAGYGPSFSW